MIDKRITELAQNFATSWTKIFKEHPRYVLDFSWPSLGTVDMLLRPLRTDPNPGPQSNIVMLGAGAYLTEMWYYLWNLFHDRPEITVSYDENEPPRIILEVRGGQYLEKEETTRMDLMPVLWEVVRHPERVFPYFEKQKINIDLGFQRIPLFFLGLITGLSPYFEGPWKQKKDKDLVEYIARAERYLAATTAAFYSQVYPSEPLGARPRVYIDGIIMPPPAHRQNHVVSCALYRLLDQEAGSHENHALWLENLSMIPNNLIAIPALVSRIAACRAAEDDRLKALCQAQGDTVFMLREALSFARTLRNRPGLPEIALDQDDAKEAALQLELECALGIYPQLFLTPAELLSRRSVELIVSLSRGTDADRAEYFRQHAKDDPDWLLQASCFAAFAGDVALALDLFNQASGDPSRTPRPDRLSLTKCTLLLAEGRLDEAETAFRDLPDSPTRLRLLSGLLTLQSRTAELKTLLSEAGRESELEVPLLIDLVDLLDDEADFDLWEWFFPQLLRRAPNCSGTVNALIRYSIRKANENLSEQVEPSETPKEKLQ